MVDLFNSVTANTTMQIVILFLVILFLKDTVVISMNLPIYVDISDLSFFALLKKIDVQLRKHFYGAVNYVHILFSFCFLFRKKKLIHGSLAPIMHFYNINNNTVYRYII